MDPAAANIASQLPIGIVSDIQRLGNGRHNSTFLIKASKGNFVLQKMNASLGLGVMEDMRSVTNHLALRKILTLQVVATENGSLVYTENETMWRMTTFIEGSTIEKNPTTAQIESAALMVARFHSALTDYTKTFAHRIAEVQNPSRAYGSLRETIETFRLSDKNTTCAPLREEILRRAEHHVEYFDTLPLRALHGDPKLNNIRFNTSGSEAIALIDLDTLGMYHLPLELGDMLRSWCSEIRDGKTVLNIETWKTALAAYRAHAPFATPAEIAAIPDGFIHITLSLAARYLTDAYEERYFAFDSANYANLFEQNVARSKIYLALYDDFMTHESELRALSNN